MAEKALLIAEKPSLMRTIKDVYDKHRSEIPYDITFECQFGHLVTLKLPHEIEEDRKKWKWENLPFHPEDHGGWQYKVIEDSRGKNAQLEKFNAIKKHLHSGKFDVVINAGDPDQEGELLIRLVLAHAGNKLPVKRFWTNDLTESHILNGLKTLKDDDKDPMCVNLLAAAKARQHSDYRIGMNISEAATLKMNARVPCGRVKDAILAIVCRRMDEIRNFKPSSVYGVKSVYSENFTGALFDAKNETADEDATPDQKAGIIWFDTKAEAEELIADLPATATVVSFEKKKTETYAPKLYKLATLQVDAGKLGYNDADTLKIVQGLYEREFLSYPRTDCEYLSSGEDFKGILKAVMAVPTLAPHIRKVTASAISRVRGSKKWINDKALEEAGHSAIRPTTKAPDISKLSKAEQDIYTLVCTRFVAMFLPPIVQDKTQLVADAGGHTFKSAGKTLIDPGFSVLFGTKFTDMVIPEKKPGDVLDVTRYEPIEKAAVCPKRYTSPGLIEACESPAKFLNDASLKALGKRLKIGTSATRSAIIRQLIEKDKFLAEKTERKVTYIEPTEMGEAVYRNLGDCDICKVDLTGIWEEKLEDIRQGKLALDDFEVEMRAYVERLIDDIKGRSMTGVGTAVAAGGKSPAGCRVIGKCPKCGKDLYESPKGYYCLGYKDTPKCNVGAFNKVCESALSAKEFLSLMEGKTISKRIKHKDRTWTQMLKYDFDTCKVVFTDGDEKEIGVCPKCGGHIMMSENRFRCDGCAVAGYRNILNVKLQPQDIIDMLYDAPVTVTLTKDGRSWEQKLIYSFGENRVTFVKDEVTASEHECPFCGSPMEENSRKVSCSCGFTIWKNYWGRLLEKQEISDLCKHGQTEVLDDIPTQSGNPRRGRFAVDKANKKVVLMFEK